jgi:hypothetical protein
MGRNWSKYLMSNKLVRSIGWILSIVVTAGVTWWVAYWVPTTNIFSWSLLGGIVTFVVLVALVYGIVVALRRKSYGLLIGAILVIGFLAFMLGRQRTLDLLLAIPLTAILVAILAAIVLGVLYTLTIDGGLPAKLSKKVVVTSTEEKTAKVTDISTPASSASAEK